MIVEWIEALVIDSCEDAWDEIEDIAVKNGWKLVAIAAMLGFMLALP